MSNQLIDVLCERLVNFRERPLIYLGRSDVEAALHFLNGFEEAVVAALHVSQDVRFAVREYAVLQRGWDWLSAHPYHQMIQRGMSSDAIIVELIDLEYDILRRLQMAVA